MTPYRSRRIGGREAAVWLVGLCCGAAAAGDAAVLPGGTVLVLAGVPLVVLAVRLWRSRRRAVVWEERDWPLPGEPARRPDPTSGAVGRCLR